MDGTEAHTAIRRIADTLGVSEAAFNDHSAGRMAPAIDMASQETELLEMFGRIVDPGIRQSCIEYVRCRIDGTTR